MVRVGGACQQRSRGDISPMSSTSCARGPGHRLGPVLAAVSLLLRVVSVSADASGGPGEPPRPRVILEAGAIDSSTVEVDATAVVVYGLGYRDPVSGRWPRLARARGSSGPWTGTGCCWRLR